MPDRSGGDSVLQVGDCAWGYNPTTSKILIVEKLLTIAAGRKGKLTSNRKSGQGSSWTIASAEEI
jgi:hypothetical protein